MPEAWILWDVKSLSGGDLELDYGSYNQVALGSIFGSKTISIEDVGTPVYKTKSRASEIKGRHLLPTYDGVVLSKELRYILECQEIPSNDIQFCPVKIVCNREVNSDYFLLLVHRTVNCVNLESTGILSYSRFGGFIRINEAKYFEYYPNCLKDALIARDACQPDQLIFAEVLKELFLKVDANIDFRLPRDICAPRWNCT